MPKIKKEFSDREKNSFLKESFERLITYFKTGLEKLKKHDPTIETDYDEITKRKYIFEIYRSGTMITTCKIWLGRPTSLMAMCYKEGDFDIDNDSSLNEWIHAEDDGLST